MNNSLSKLENSAKTLICCGIMKKASSLCKHNVWPYPQEISLSESGVGGKRCSYLQTPIELHRMIRLTYVNFVFSSYLPLMFLFSKLLLMLELVSLFPLDIHYLCLSGCLFL